MKAKVLIVEDEENILLVLKEILELSDYYVLTARNGREGYEVIMNQSPDLVLCDVNMPEIDGFTLLKTINQKLSLSERPVFLFLTARVESLEIRKGMNLGADDYILKPFETSDVLDAIKLRLDKRDSLLNIEKTKESVPVPQIDQTKKLAIPTGEGLQFVEFKNILLCMADRSYCKFFILNKPTILVSKPMKEFENELINHGFYKVHKSSIVNLSHIVKYEKGAGGSLELIDGTRVVVSTRRKESLISTLNSI